MECARQRRTFVAVSFKMANAHLDSAYTLSYVNYQHNKLVNEGALRFRPLRGCRGKFAKYGLFEVEFEEVKSLITADDIPVLVWDDKAIKVFDALILGSSNGIIMTRPPRYFRVRNYAVQQIGKVAANWTWEQIAKHFKMNSAPCLEPDAAHIAALMIKIEDQIHFPSIVAKAFCKFCESILEDDVVSLNEAMELRAFVLLISDKYTQFKKLEEVLADVLEDGKVTEAESGRLVRILKEMMKYYSKFITGK